MEHLRWSISQPFPHGVSISQQEGCGWSCSLADLPQAVTRDQRFGWEPSPKKSVLFHLLVTDGKRRGERCGGKDVEEIMSLVS